MSGLKAHLHTYVLQLPGTLTNAVGIQKAAQIASCDVALFFFFFYSFLRGVSTSKSLLRHIISQLENSKFVAALYNPVCIR